MRELNSLVAVLDADLKRSLESKRLMSDLLTDLKELELSLADGLEAQKLLGTVSDERSAQVLNYITSVINKALAEIFPGDELRLDLERKLHAGRYPHINVVLHEKDGKARDLTMQSGTGLRQIVSFLYRVCLLEVTGGRKLILMDELLGGVHQDAIVIIMDLMRIFADGGFQFVVIDYAIREDFGKMYKVVKTGKIAEVIDFADLDEIETVADVVSSGA